MCDGTGDSSPTVSGVVFSGAFGGAVLSSDSNGNVYTYPSGAEAWGGFANEDTSMYPLSFPDGGSITFEASSAGIPAEIYFRFEKNPHPDTDPAFDTATVTVADAGTASATYTVAIDPQDAGKTFSSFLLYVKTRDVAVTINNVQVTTGTDASSSTGGGASASTSEGASSGGGGGGGGSMCYNHPFGCM